MYLYCLLLRQLGCVTVIYSIVISALNVHELYVPCPQASIKGVVTAMCSVLPPTTEVVWKF